MGIVYDPKTRRMITLPAECRIGRSFECTVRLDIPNVSGQHARIWYQSKGWRIRDLSSRNGTFVNGQKVEEATLEKGDLIMVGSTKNVLKFVDTSPPVALARNLKSDEVIVSQNGLLSLPPGDSPQMLIFETPQHGWVLETGGNVELATDHQAIEVNGKSYMLHLPTIPIATMDSSGEWISVNDVGLHFRVRRNEEYVDVAVEIRKDNRVVLTPRAHHYTLLQLARARYEDEKNTKVPEAERGWVTMDYLCKALATDENKINVEIFRIRKEFLQLPVQNGAAIIERRRGTRLLRIGVRAIRIEYID